MEVLGTLIAENPFILAPMVEYGQLPFRMLVRRYGFGLCYTPMIHSRLFLTDSSYRSLSMISCEHDRPLIYQFCANDPDIFLESARLVAPHCISVDLNLGCPQNIARRGHYGAFLQDEWSLIREIVNRSASSLSLPVSCKIRVFDDVQKTQEYARMLERSGCSAIAVHGRTLEQKGQQNMGSASWDHIAAVKKCVRIPVIANGDVKCREDAENCFRQTNCDAVMIAREALYNPKLLMSSSSPVQIALEFLTLVKQYPVPRLDVRGHLHKLLAPLFKQSPLLRDILVEAKDIEQCELAVVTIDKRFSSPNENEPSMQCV